MPDLWVRRNPPTTTFTKWRITPHGKALHILSWDDVARLIRPCIIKPMLFEQVLNDKVSANTYLGGIPGLGDWMPYPPLGHQVRNVDFAAVAHLDQRSDSIFGPDSGSPHSQGRSFEVLS